MTSGREQLAVLIAASSLVITRGAIYAIYPQSFFDSDQAIIGLMAKHLIEGRAFPLFYYGQTYLLGVEAWIAAPFFLIAGPTVAALRASLILTNLVIAGLLIVTLVRACGLRPFDALVASLFFVFAPPMTAASLVEAGANIGPFLWVVLLWRLRDRPLWFGAVLAFGFLNREFTIYAVPPILLAQLLDRSLFRVERVRAWLLALVAFFAVWQTVEALKPYADLMGPGTRGELVHGSPGSQVGNIVTRVAVVPAELRHRAIVMAADFLPREIGARAAGTWTASQGRDWMRWPLELGLLVAAIRAWLLARRRTPAVSLGFAWHLAGVGLTAAVVYILTRPADIVVDRYLLLTLYLPVGIVAAFLAVESRAWLRWAMVAFVSTWAVISAIDHGRLAVLYVRHTPQDAIGQLVEGLAARNIQVAEARYWRAYNVSFLSRERVKVASTDVVRIGEYQRLANAAGDRLIELSEVPCPGEKLLYWYLCKVPR